MTSDTTPAPRAPTAVAAELFLLLFPAAQLLFLQVAGAIATAADVVAVALLVVFAGELAVRREARQRLRSALVQGAGAGSPGRAYGVGLGVLVLFGAWIALSGSWGFHPRYALAKGAATIALTLTAGALATSGLGWRRATDAWLGGTALALLVTLVVGITGPDVLRDRVFYGGGGVLGLPFPRVAGPLLHPNMMGDYLLVSGLILWGRWPDFGSGRRRGAALALAAGVGIGLLLTVSTAWIAAGVVVVLLGRALAREGAGPRRPAVGNTLRLAGLLVAAATLIAVAAPVDVTLGPLTLITGGIRPAIWKASLDPFVHAPLLGVGAAPFLAEVADPLQGGLAALWDAHNAYLSVLGQFGLVGAALAGGGLWLVLKGAYAGVAPSRARTAMTLVLVAVAVNGFFLAGEDSRHLWVLLGIVGLMGGAEEGE